MLKIKICITKRDAVCVYRRKIALKKKKLNKIYIVVGVWMTESFGARMMMLWYSVLHAQTLNNNAHTSCRGVLYSSVASLQSRFVYRRQCYSSRSFYVYHVINNNNNNNTLCIWLYNIMYYKVIVELCIPII